MGRTDPIIQESFLPDYEVNNWYTSTHPANLYE
jgi:hypothetical protein